MGSVTGFVFGELCFDGAELRSQARWQARCYLSCGLVGSLHGDVCYEVEIELLLDGNIKISLLFLLMSGLTPLKYLKPQMKQS